MNLGMRCCDSNTMFGSEIQSILDKFASIEKHFLGVKSIDTWPIHMSDLDFFISNTSPANQPGSHWFFVGINAESIVEVFDCLAPSREIIFKAKQFRDLVDTNSQELMPKSSSLCGHYTVYFALHRHFNPQYHMMDILIEFFYTDKMKNDKIVQKFLSEI